MPPPPLNRWQSTWRYLVAVLISLLAWVEVVDKQAEETPYLFWLELIVLAISLVVVRYRRRYPLPVVIVLTALSSFFALATGPCGAGLVSLATRRLWREIIPAASNRDRRGGTMCPSGRWRVPHGGWGSCSTC